MKKSVFADLTVTKVPESIPLDIYSEDFKTLMEFWDFKKKQLKGDIPFAEVFSRLVRTVWQDAAFCAANGATSGKKVKHDGD